MTDEPRCRLCQQSAILRKSHILSEFLYSSVYAENHRFLQVSTDPGVSTLTRATGLYERLMCTICEGRLSRWESYAAGVLNGGIELQVENEARGFVVHGVDYKTFKLFGMSLLWRASISSRSEFSDVQLGPHEEVIRRMLLEENPGRRWEYGFAILFPPEPEARSIFGEAIIPPERVPYGGRCLYRFFLGVTSWQFLVSRRMRPADEMIFSLREDGSLRIRSGGQHMMDFLNRFVREIASANSARTPAGPQDRGGRVAGKVAVFQENSAKPGKA